jgi:hypothetical protein
VDRPRTAQQRDRVTQQRPRGRQPFGAALSRVEALIAELELGHGRCPCRREVGEQALEPGGGPRSPGVAIVR